MPDVILPFAVPETIAGYKVIGTKGSGAWGHGLQVLSKDGSAHLFLKLVKPGTEPEGNQRLENEIWALRHVGDHPAFVKLLDEGMIEGRKFYVSTLAKGERLRDLQQRHIAQHGTPVGPRFVSVVIDRILEGVVHLQTRDLLHRDLKDDNITATESGNDVSIIDLGSCKGEGRPHSNLTWTNPGATRFSPPARDQTPSLRHSTHDVYSIGILAYFLLTDAFPFEVEKAEGPNRLMQKKREFKHKPVWDMNGHVPQALSDWIDALITPHDEQRPGPAAALSSLRTIRLQMDKTIVAPSIKPHGKILYSEVVRDPLHGDIRLTDTEYKIIHTPEFVRLRKLKQLGFAYIPFPGAEHTRYLHSLGCVYVTERILRSIEDVTGIAISAEDRLLARAYGLLHDIGHIPFGHTLEDELGIFERHDRNHRRNTDTILDEKTPLGKLVFTSEIDRVRDFFQRDATVSRLNGFRELQESVVGADVLDYIDRDSMFCGLDHRIDSALFRRFRLRGQGASQVVQGNFYTTMFGGQGLRLDVEFGAETIFLERFALYLKVYTHAEKVCAGAMLGKALWDHMSGEKKRDKCEVDVEKLGDAGLLLWLSEKGRTASVKEIAAMLKEETLFLPVYRTSLMAKDSLDYPGYLRTQERLRERELVSPKGRHAAEVGLSKTVGNVPEGKIIVYCPESAPGYAKITQWVEDKKRGNVEERTEAHPMHQRVEQRHLALWNAYVFCHPDVAGEDRARLSAAAGEMFGKSNEMPTRMQQTLFLDL